MVIFDWNKLCEATGFDGDVRLAHIPLEKVGLDMESGEILCESTEDGWKVIIKPL